MTCSRLPFQRWVLASCNTTEKGRSRAAVVVRNLEKCNWCGRANKVTGDKALLHLCRHTPEQKHSSNEAFCQVIPFLFGLNSWLFPCLGEETKPLFVQPHNTVSRVTETWNANFSDKAGTGFVWGRRKHCLAAGAEEGGTDHGLCHSVPKSGRNYNLGTLLITSTLNLPWPHFIFHRKGTKITLLFCAIQQSILI